MAVLKMVYSAHGWTLALLDRPLFNNRIEAWRFGPVVPELYHDRRERNARQVLAYDEAAAPNEAEIVSILQQVWDIYGGMHPFRLSDLTHVRGGPWDQVTRASGGRSDAEIPDWLIQQHYLEKNQQAQAENV